INDEVLAAAKFIRQCLATRSDLAVRQGWAVSHGDNVAAPGEDVGFTERYVIFLKLCGPHHNEKRIAVDLELRPLMSAERILDSEIVQPERPLNFAQKLFIGLMQPNPNKAAGTGRHLIELIDLHVGGSPPLLISGALDDHAHDRPPKDW